MGVVVFDPTAFKQYYPEFAGVLDTTLQYKFNKAQLYLDNSPCSPVQCMTRRAVLLNLLTAHIATVDGTLQANGLPLPVGRVSNASEGSVSAAFVYSQANAGSADWFNQTQYGAEYWTATISLRSFKYFPNPTRW